MANMELGACFNSYSEFETCLNEFKTKRHCDFYISDCRTLDAAKKRFPIRAANPCFDLKYYSAKFLCVHGGSFKKKKNNLGLRKTSSMRLGCTAFINIKLSTDGKQLVITDISNEHNHQVVPDQEEQLSKQQKYRKASVMTNKLAVLVSKSNQFESKIDFLQNLYDSWVKGKEVALNMSEEAHTLSAPSPSKSAQEVAEFSACPPNRITQLLTSISNQSNNTKTNSVLPCASGCIKLNDIKLPQKVRSRARPKRSSLTVIEVPEKQNTYMLVPFVKNLFS